MMARLFLGLNAAVIGLIGLVYLYDPNLLLGRYGLETGGAGLDNMLRSTYGGVFVGVAAIFLLGALHDTRRRDALALAAIFMGGLALGRLMSIASLGAPPPSLMPLLYYEIAAAIIAAALYSLSPQPQQA